MHKLFLNYYTDRVRYFKQYIYIIESIDTISRDEPDSPETQYMYIIDAILYITNAEISHARSLGTLSCILNSTIVFYS